MNANVQIILILTILSGHKPGGQSLLENFNAML